MGRFVQGEDRRQDYLLPASLDDYVSEENPVRAIEAFIDALDLKALEFAGMTPAETGRPAYHPATMLKIYLYGYLNRVRSNRRLERETQRNVELMWLNRQRRARSALSPATRSTISCPSSRQMPKLACTHASRSQSSPAAPG